MYMKFFKIFVISIKFYYISIFILLKIKVAVPALILQPLCYLCILIKMSAFKIL